MEWKTSLPVEISDQVELQTVKPSWIKPEQIKGEVKAEESDGVLCKDGEKIISAPYLRYALKYTFNDSNKDESYNVKNAMVLMLNPSVGGPEILDKTLNVLLKNLHDKGFTTLYIVNVTAVVSQEPRMLGGKRIRSQEYQNTRDSNLKSFQQSIETNRNVIKSILCKDNLTVFLATGNVKKKLGNVYDNEYQNIVNLIPDDKKVIRFGSDAPDAYGHHPLGFEFSQWKI